MTERPAVMNSEGEYNDCFFPDPASSGHSVASFVLTGALLAFWLTGFTAGGVFLYRLKQGIGKLTR